MFKIYLVAIYLFTVLATVLDEHKNTLMNVDSENEDLDVDENSSSDDEHTDSSISSNESENEEQDDPVKYKNLFKIVSSLVEKELLVEQEINKLLCLDLNLGNKWRKEILKRLEKFLKNNDFKFGCFFLHSCLETLRDDNLADHYKYILLKDKSDDDSIFEVNENIKLDDLQQKRLRIIINELFYYEAGENNKIKHFEENLNVRINSLKGYDFHEKKHPRINESNAIIDFINNRYLRFLFCKRQIMFWKSEESQLRLLLQNCMTKVVKDDEIQKYVNELRNSLDNLRIKRKLFIVPLNFISRYSDYDQFIKKFYPSENNKRSLEINSSN